MTDTTQPTTAPTLTERLTGSTGNAVQDGTMRGAIVAVVNGVIALVATEVTVDADQLALIFALVNPALFIAFGIFDKYVR